MIPGSSEPSGSVPEVPPEKPKIVRPLRLNPLARDAFLKHYVRKNSNKNAVFRVLSVSGHFMVSAKRIASQRTEINLTIFDNNQQRFGLSPLFPYVASERLLFTIFDWLNPRIQKVTINNYATRSADLSPKLFDRLLNAKIVTFNDVKYGYENDGGIQWFPIFGKLLDALGLELRSLECPANFLQSQRVSRLFELDVLVVSVGERKVSDFDSVLGHKCRHLVVKVGKLVKGFKITDSWPKQESIQEVSIHARNVEHQRFMTALFDHLPNVKKTSFHC